MMCMTVLHGGVCHRTSTPHKSGNKMKEKKKEVSVKCENVVLTFATICSRDDFPGDGSDLSDIPPYSVYLSRPSEICLRSPL